MSQEVRKLGILANLEFEVLGISRADGALSAKKKVDTVLPMSSSTNPTSAMDTRSHLPPEVIGRITECLATDFDKKTLLSLALTSRACRMESQRVLFKTMEVRCAEGPKKIQAVMLAHSLFLEAIVSAPTRLGPYVRTYTCIWLAISPVDTDFHSDESFQKDHNQSFNRPNLKAGMRLWNTMLRALPFMARLEHLTLAVGNILEWGHCTNGVSILRHCHSALESLVWGSSLDFPALAADVLPHQPNLRVFGIYHHVEGKIVPLVTNFPPSALLRLKNINGPTSALLAFLPTRNVEAVSWTLDPEHDDLEQAGQALSRTRYLCMSESQGLNRIAEHLVSVEVLCLKTYSTIWNPDFSQLAALTSLRTLILQNQTRWPQYDDEEEPFVAWWSVVDAIAATAFATCSTLERVLAENPYNSWEYTPIKRTGDGMEVGDVMYLSEIMGIFEPWMPGVRTKPDNMHYYM